MLEHMVFKGSMHYADGEIAREIEQNGGYLNAFTSYDETGYVVDLPASSLAKGLSVLKEMAFLPAFSPEHLQSEKEVIVAELKRGLDSPGNVLFEMMSKNMFQGSSYAHPIIGYEEAIRSLTVQDLHDYRQRWYQPQAMVLVVYGNIDLDEAEQLVSETFSPFTNTHSIVRPQTAIPLKKEPSVHATTGPWQKVRLALAFPAPALTDSNAIYLDLLTHIIGGDSTSYLYKKYKYEKRIVDTIALSNYSFENSGIVFVTATLDRANVMPFWQELAADLQKGFAITASDVSRAQLALTDSFYRAKETFEGMASQIGHFHFYHRGDADAANYLTTIGSATPEMLSALYSQIFQPQQAGIYAIIPQDSGQGASLTANLETGLLTEFAKVWPTNVPGQQQAGMASTREFTEPEIIQLGNERSVVLYPDNTLPYFAATLSFKGGESLLDKNTQGLGSFTAGLLTRGSAGKTYNATQTFLAERAATLRASSGKQSFSISFSAPAKYTSDLFNLVRELVGAPDFLPEEGERVKENIQAAIIRAEEQPVSLVLRYFPSLLYPDHPYGYLHLGTKETIAAMTAQQARTQWEEQRLYPWTLSVSGDFSRDEILTLAQQLPQPQKKAGELAMPNLATQKEFILPLADREQAHLLLVFPTPGIGNADEAGLELLTSILAGQSGLLFTELRDKQGLGYSVTAFPWKTQKAGALIMYIGTDPDTIDDAHAGFTRVINDLKNNRLDPAVIQRGKNIMSGEYHRERQSLSARSTEGATLVTLGLPLRFKSDLINEAQRISPTDIKAIAQKYFDMENSFVIKVLPENKK